MKTFLLALSILLPLSASALPIVVDPATPLSGTFAVEWNTPNNFESWTTSQVTSATVSGGILSGTTNGTDPLVSRSNFGSGPDLDLGFNDYLELRMKVPASYADNIEIYYGTTGTTGFSGARIITIPNATIPKDGGFHTYRIDVGPEPWWRATLRDLRVDPGNLSGVAFAIDYLRVGDEPNPTIYQPRFTTKCPAAAGATPADAYFGAGQAVSSLESKHFRFLWNTGVTGQSGWTASTARGTLRNMEEAWQVYVKILGYREPAYNVGTTSGTAYKLNVTSYYDGFWAGLDDHGGISLAQLNITPGGLQVDPPTWVIPHELMHCFQFHNTSGNVNGEWFETHANYARERWLQHYQVLYPNRSNIESLGVRDGHFMMSSGRNYYLTWPFMYYVDTNPDNLPDLSEGMIKRVWQETQPGEFSMMALDRITPTTSLKDLSGYYARRCATWDFSNQSAMTTELNLTIQDPTRNARHLFTDLIQRPDAPTWWRVPPNKAPAQGAYAMHELIPAGSGAGRVVTVNLQGLADAARGADWRASLIAVSDTGVERYTPLWSNGSSSITLAANENKLYLSVAGTPEIFHYGGHDEANYHFRSHPSRSRFHYEVQVTGATPRERNNGATTGLTQHSNGNGWKSVTVPASVYIGPNARVTGGSVSGDARIEDYAVVSGGTVNSSAVISGHAWVRGGTVTGNARVRDWAIVDSGTLSGNARALEHATVAASMQDTAVAKGSALHQIGGVLSGNAIVDGDYMFNKSISNGVTFGHLPFVGVPDNFTTATPTGLYAAYNFDTFHDSRSLDQYGITDAFTIGSPAWTFTDGKRKGFLKFNGSSQSITLDRSVADSRAFTFAAWVKPAGGPANQAVLWLGATPTRRLSLTPDDGSGHAKFSIINGGAEQTLSSATALPTGVWSHVAVTLDGSTGVLYIGGSVAASGPITIRPDQLLAANTTTGAQHNYLARSEGSAMPMFQGSLDDAQFFSSALSAAQLTAATVPLLSGVGTLLLSDSFSSGSYSFTDFNSTLTADQQGLLAPTAYTVTTGGQDWQSQHGNGSTMLLVGDAGYGSRASLNEDFSIAANGLNLPISFQMDAWVDTGNNDCWSSVTLGSGQNLFAYSSGAKFGILPKKNGNLEVWVNGSLQPLASHSGNSYRIVLSDTAGTGSAFNGNGSKAALFNGATLVSTYPLPQLVPGDGFLSFGAQPDNGYTLTRIDNLSISQVPLTSFTWAGGTGDWTDMNWLPGSVTGPTASGLTGVVNAGTVTLGQATLGSFAAIATIGAGALVELNTAADIALNSAVVFSGDGAIRKSGAGTLTLSAANTYTGGTTINDGTLKLVGSAFSTTARTYSIASGAVFNLDGNTNFASGITTIGGDGTLRISGGQFTAGADGRDLTLAMGGGGLIDIQAGAAMDNGGWQSVTWTDNKASLNVNGTLDVWDGQNVFADALTGSGSVTIGNVTWSALNTTLSVGLNGGSGTFGGVISGTGSGDDTLNLTKQGGGTQTLSGANTYTGLTNIYAGTLVAANNTALGAGGHNGNTMTYIHDGATLAMQGGISLDEHFHVWGAGVSGLGALRSISGNNTLSNSPGGGPGFNLRSNTTVGVDADTLTVSGFYDNDGGNFGITKVGAGTLTLKAACTYAGSTTVSAGTLLVDTTGTLGSGSLTVANNAVCELRNPSGGVANSAAVTLNGNGRLNLASGVTETVGTLIIDGILQARGTWNATRDPLHFTGTGSLFVTDGPAADADGTWTSLADGVWNQTGSWQNGDVAKGTDKTATFNQSTGTTITVDGSRTIGHLVFDGSDYRLVGEALTLASTSGTSTISVAASRSAFVSAALTGSVGLHKTGEGTLALGGTNSYTGGTTVSAGTLRVTADTTAGVTIANAGFESPGFGDGGWSYTPSGADWSFNAAGIGRNGSPWVTTSPQGQQVGFVQGSGTLSQSLNITTGGFYDLTFKAANRPNYPDSGIAIQIDGVTVRNYPAGTFASGGAFQIFVVRGILLEAGSRTLTFVGSLNGGDSATAIDAVGLTGYAAGSLPTGTALALSGGTLQLDVTQTVGSLAGVSGAQLVNKIALTVNDATDTAFDGVISGAGDLVKVGTGTLSLTGTTSYTGTTTIQAGTLRLGNGTSPTNLSDSADVIVAAGAMLDLNYTGTDHVAGLWVDGSQLPPGVYSSSSGFITGTGTLTVATGPATADYVTWSGRGIHNLAEGLSGDDDKDSIANVLEYVLGGDPRAASSGILPVATVSSGNLVFTFRRVHSTTADTIQLFQYGTDLSDWTDVPVVAGGMVAIQPDTPKVGTDTVTITVPAGTNPRVFGRIKVSTPPAQP